MEEEGGGSEEIIGRPGGLAGTERPTVGTKNTRVEPRLG